MKFSNLQKRNVDRDVEWEVEIINYVFVFVEITLRVIPHRLYIHADFHDSKALFN